MRPDQTRHQEAITSADMLYPNLTTDYRGGRPAEAYYKRLQDQGKDCGLTSAMARFSSSTRSDIFAICPEDFTMTKKKGLSS